MARRDEILVVEDDRGIRDLLANRLTQFSLTFATCQAEAYEQLQSGTFDLVLLDLRLTRNPKDMSPTNKVGIDILKEIRKRGLVKRDSAMLMPVVVMTAYGSEKLSAEILVGNGANDYIPKPFGTGNDLEHKIGRALAGDGALLPAANIVGSSVRTIGRQRGIEDPAVLAANVVGSSVHIAFHPTDGVVRVETFTYRGAHHGLLAVLRDQHVKDLNELLMPEKFNGIRGDDLATEMNITGKAARARVVKFRQQVKHDFQRLGRAVDDNDIVENPRNWKGYRLNPRTVRVVRWDQLVEGDE